MFQVIGWLIFIVLSFVSIILCLAYVSIFLSAFSFAPWVPSKNKDLARAIGLADLKSDEVFADLGCGDGRAVFAANRIFKVKAIGIELAWPLYLFCQAKKRLFYNQQDIVFKRANLFKEDLSQMDIIFVYGMPKPLKERLKSKLEMELKKGARVVSYGFPIAGLKPALVDQPSKKYSPVFVYRF
jgi:SAM-dependent methyltransferase